MFSESVIGKWELRIDNPHYEYCARITYFSILFAFISCSF